MIGIIARVLTFFGGLTLASLGVSGDDLLMLVSGTVMAAFVLGDTWGRTSACVDVIMSLRDCR